MNTGPGPHTVQQHPYPVGFTYRPSQGSLVASPQQAQVWSSLACVALHAVVVLLAATSLYLTAPWLTLSISGIMVAVLYSKLSLNEARRGPFWLNPLSFYFAWTVVGLGISPLYIATIILDNQPVPFSVTVVTAEDIATGYCIALLGSFALHAGLQFARPGKRGELQGARIPAFVSLRGFFALWLAGLVFTYRPTRFLGTGILGTLLLWGPYAATLTLALLPARTFRISESRRWVYLSIGTLGLLIIALAAEFNSKAFLMFSLFPPLIALWKNFDLRKWAILGVVLLAILYLGVVAPSINSSRYVSKFPYQKPIDRVIEGFKTTSIFSTAVTPQYYVDQAEQFLTRMFESVSIGFIVSEVRIEGFKYGETMSNLAYAFIPRFIWPEKPIVNRGAWFTYYLGVSPTPEDATTSTGMDASGELYWNFGVPGVLVGMFLLGVLISGLWRMVGEDFLGKIVPMLLYVTITFSMFNMPEASTVLVSLVAFYVIFGMLFLYQRSAALSR